MTAMLGGVWKSGQPLYLEGTAGDLGVHVLSNMIGTNVLTAGEYDVLVSIKGTAVGSGTAIVTAP